MRIVLMKTSPWLALLVPLVLVAPGCGALSDESGSDGDRVQVAAGFYPLAWVAEQVAGDRADVVNLTKPGQEAHEAGLSIEKTADLASADLALTHQALQPEVFDAAETNAQGKVLDVEDVVDLAPAGTGHDHDEHDDHDDHGDEGHEDDGHDHGDEDPHFWLDPLLMADLGDAVAEELSEIDPEGAEQYADSAEALRGRLEELDREYTDGLAGCERNVVVVSHDAFGYLGRYGLEFEPIAGLSPDAEPTAADLQHLQELIRDEGLTTVFSETLGSSAPARSLAKDTGLRTDTLDPIEGLSGSGSQADYLSLMRDNLDALRKADGC